ncbi:serine dehydratase, partial [Staphylococcus aureus]|nr:serine dehydratase [Staphylococcus aureus]
DINDMKLDCKDEFIKIDEDKCLVVIPLNKAISESTLNTIKEKYSDVNVSYIN